VEADKRFGLVAAFRKPSSDPEWAQYLSDVARKHLADILNIKAGDLPKRFETEIREMHGQEKVPTLSAVMGALGIEGTRREELFRWSLFLYTDGDACPIEIHRYPHIAPKA
jgi:hypothetical protein